MKYRFVVVLLGLLGVSLLASCEAETNMLKRDSSLVAGLDTTVSEDAAAPVAFYVRNDADSAVKLLAWNTPFETFLSADIFRVKINGESVTYIGRVIKRGEPLPEDYITIGAGERREVTVDLARYYDMTLAGEYRVSFKLPLDVNDIYDHHGVAISLEVNELDVIVR